MFFIPGIIISILTFPGVIIHEFGHYIFCKVRKVQVFDAKFFQLNLNVSGYVIHKEPDDFLSVFLISIGPLIVNTILCLLVTLPAAIPYYLFGDRSIITYFYIWLGLSIGMHAFPSNQDANNLWLRAKEEVKKRNILAIISLPLCVLVFIANLLRIIWFDAIYAFSVAILLPQFVVIHMF
jgi:hypothetical protein